MYDARTMSATRRQCLIGIDDITGKYLSTIYSNSKSLEMYPSSLKIADVTSNAKTNVKTSYKQYRPVSLIPIISKLYERNMLEQTSVYIEKILSPYLVGCRKWHSREHCLMVVIVTWKEALDRNGAAGVILADLSKACDCLSHDVLIAKLEAYGFGHSALTIIYDYMENEKQGVNVAGSYSSCKMCTTYFLSIFILLFMCIYFNIYDFVYVF